MQITINMIETKEFKIKARGYDQEEVDTFLDEICDEMERQINLIARLQQQLKEAQVSRPAAPAAAPVAPSALMNAAVGADDVREVLEMAQQVKSQTIADAQRKADEILSEAETKARGQLSDLIAQRDSLQAEVSALKAAASDYRARFKALVDAQKDILDKAGL